MLQQMRKFASSWVASIFLGLLALSFGVWGIADIFRGTTETNVAHVGNEAVSQNAFQNEYQLALRNVSARMGTQLSSEQAKAIGLPQQTLERMLSRIAVDIEVHRLGLTATDDAVAQQVRAVPAFQGPSGSFDHATFLRVIQQSGYTEEGFINAVRSDIARGQLLTAVKAGVEVPDGYAHALFNYLNEARAVSYIVVPPSAAGKTPTPSDVELEAYVKKNAARFSTPEYRELTYAAITPADLASKITVTSKELHNEYELNKSDYQVPEKRDVEQITFPDKKTADAAYAKIQKGESFEAIAKARGLKKNDIDLGEVEKADLGADRGAAAFALAENKISQPVKGPFGWVLLKVTKIVPGTSKSFDEVKAELTKKVYNKLALDKISEIVNNFEDDMAGGDTLTQAATKSGMKAAHVKAVDKAGLTPDDSKADVPTKPQFLAQVFKADVGIASDPFQLADGSAYAIKVEGVTPPKLKPLDKVRKVAESEWMAGRQAQALLAKAKALAAAATKDKSLAATAKSVHATVQQSGRLERGTPSGPFPTELVSAIFDAPPGTAVFGKAAKGNDYIVARITGVDHPPQLPVDDPQYSQFITQIGEQIGNDLPTSLAMAARKQAGVTIDQKVVDQVVGSGS